MLKSILAPTLFSVRGWHFDLLTAFLTLVVTPLALAALKIIVRHLRSWLTYAFESAMYTIGSRVRKSIAAALALKRYARIVIAGPSKDLYVPASADITLAIDKVYIPLLLESRGGAQRTYDEHSLFAISNRLRIIGDPGSGKSSLLKRILRNSCHEALRAPTKARLPVAFELKQLRLPQSPPTDWGIWLYDQIRAQLAVAGVYGMAECLDSYAVTTGVIMLLDGLDEIITADYLSAEAAILALSATLQRKSPNNVIILTSRIQFHQQIRDAYRDAYPHVLTIMPFTPTDIYEFLTKWPFRENRAGLFSRVYNELTDRPSLRELCSNPLILSMYVADADNRGTLAAPDSRTEFYSKITEELLIKRRLRQTGVGLAQSVVRRERQRILGNLAYQHLLDPAEPTNSLSYEKAVTTIGSLLNCSLAEAEAQFAELAKETGLISEERPHQSYKFIHLTFCEYFAALEAVEGREDGWETLIQRHRAFQRQNERHFHTRLLDVIPFAAQLLPRVRRARAIDLTASLGDYRLLALVFFETKSYDHPLWHRFVLNQQQRLLSVRQSEWDDQWLSDLHLLQVVVRDADLASRVLGGHVHTEAETDRFFETLVRQGHDGLMQLMTAYAERDAAAVFRVAEVCHIDLARDFPEIIVRFADQMPFLALVCDEAASDARRHPLWATLLAEASIRSRLVREVFANLEASDVFAEAEGAVAQKMRWSCPLLVKRTRLTQLLTIATAQRDGRCWAGLSGLARCLPPGRYRNRLPTWLTLSFLSLTIMSTLFGRSPTAISQVGVLAGGLLFAISLGRWYLMHYYYSLILRQLPFRGRARSRSESEIAAAIRLLPLLSFVSAIFAPNDLRKALLKDARERLDRDMQARAPAAISGQQAGP